MQNIIYILTITNMVILQNFDVISDKFNIARMYTSEG